MGSAAGTRTKIIMFQYRFCKKKNLKEVNMMKALCSLKQNLKYVKFEASLNPEAL